MTAKAFVDSNILVYAHDADAGPKQKIAAAQIRALWEDQSGRISTQVLQEFYVTVTQKLGEAVVQERCPGNHSRLCALGCRSNHSPDGYSRLRDQRRLETVILGQPNSRCGRGAGLLDCAHRRLEFRSNGSRNPDHQSIFAKSRHSCLIVP